ncbi:MAG: hypothetical protein Q8M02_03865 [Candidatus Didemnitutus sp.]|nr:hypothetical protein [Candidatus Didemnitutus sp.]
MRLRTHLSLFCALTGVLAAAPLSKQLEIDFFREVPARNLKALAVRSDGRVLAGPTITEIPGAIPADLLWTFAATTDHRAWLVGTGPEGKIFRVNTAGRTVFQVELAADLEATHVLAVCPLTADSFLAGTSPQGTVSLVHDGKIIAAVSLPVDSIFDFTALRSDANVVLVATGNPGRIYRIDLTAFTAAGVANGKLITTVELAAHGVTLFGEIRDRNVRRLLALNADRVIAGSAPRGNVYAFPASGGAPLLLLENKEAEITDLLADAEGGFFAALTLTNLSSEARVNRPAPTPNAPTPNTPPPTEVDTADVVRAERFSGRSQLAYFPPHGLPEIVVSRANTAFYRLAWHEDAATRWILISGGEQGELLAFSPSERRSLNLGALGSAQANAILPSQPGVRGLFHVLRNNAAGLSQLNFSDGTARSLETRRLDLGVAAELGQLRFANNPPNDNAKLQVAVRTSFGSDEMEGWTAWTDLQWRDGSWSAPDLRGRYVQLRVTCHAAADRVPALDKAVLHYLPQNRRPQLTDFRIFSPNLGIIPAPEVVAATGATTLGQLLAPPPRESKDDSAKRRTGLLSSPLVPQAGAQLIYWSITDPDDDNLVATFSLRAENATEWLDLAIETSDPFVQFDISHLPEGRYFTRLVARETAPRPVAQRLSHTFETDSLMIDRTPPEISHPIVTRTESVLRISFEGYDRLSLLSGAEVILNNGARVTLEHPLDGILDGQREAFVAEFPAARAYGATSAELWLYDAAGNSRALRVAIP